MQRLFRREFLADVALTLCIGGLGTVLLAAGASLLPATGDPAKILLSLSLDDLMGLASAIAGLALTSWWVLALLAAFAAELAKSFGLVRFSAATAKFSPVFMRRLAVAILGLNLLAAPAAMAQGDNAPVDPKWGGNQVSTSQPSQPSTSTSMATSQPSATGSSSKPLWTPQAPTIDSGPLAPALRRIVPAFPSPIAVRNPAEAPSPPVHAAPMEPAHSTVVVLRGDTLWSIAARSLGGSANNFEIAQAWPRWYAANKHIIGADPNQLLPGQILSAPR